MDKKLNNLLGIDTFSLEKMNKPAKSTKRTDVAKDVLESVKDKEEVKETKEVVISGKYNNLISLDDFCAKDLPKNDKKHSKRTETGKDIINEKKIKIEEDEDGDVVVKGKKDKSKGKKCNVYDDSCLTPKQRKLPEAFKKNLIDKMKKNDSKK
jgi:hypothetical protein